MRLSIQITAFACSLFLLSAFLPTSQNLHRTHAAIKIQNQGTTDRRRAEAAIEQLKRGERPDEVWMLLRHSANPTVRSYLVTSFARLGVDPILLIRRLEIEQEFSVRRALLLSLGEYTPEQLPIVDRRQLISRLLQWYRDDPDAGIHAATEWLLRQWKQTITLERIDRWLAGKETVRRDWYVSREGHTIIIIRNPNEFTMGSENEAGRTADEVMHRVKIPRSFAIASKEITVAQFQRFLAANSKLEMRYPDPTKDPHRGSSVMQSHSPEDQCPQIAVTWYEAAQYCNWLSKREGIPQSEWVYPIDLNEIKSGMTLSSNYLHRTGYRLLTEAEWEYTARAGSTTSRFFGDPEDLLE